MLKKDAKKIYKGILKINKEIRKILKIILKMIKKSVIRGFKEIGKGYKTTMGNFKKYSNLDSINCYIGAFLKVFTVIGFPIYEFLVFNNLMTGVTTMLDKMVAAAGMPFTIGLIYKFMESRYKAQKGTTAPKDKEDPRPKNVDEEELRTTINVQLSREKGDPSSLVQEEPSVNVGEEQGIDFSKAFEEIPSGGMTDAFGAVEPIDLLADEQEGTDLNKPMTLARNGNRNK
ncbi:MAG: hypothetical protein K2M17_02680, partial [Bacilli bacterium]|nr:hypothetical protein [Bacilli bacterium]